jgi:hypothetical protein
MLSFYYIYIGFFYAPLTPGGGKQKAVTAHNFKGEYCYNIRKSSKMNETALRAKANGLIYSLGDRKIIHAFQSMLDGAASAEQLLMLIDLIESYQRSKTEPISFLKKAIFLGQVNACLSDTLVFTGIVNDIARLFFRSQRRINCAKNDDNNSYILKARRDSALKSF